MPKHYNHMGLAKPFLLVAYLIFYPKRYLQNSYSQQIKTKQIKLRCTERCTLILPEIATQKPKIRFHLNSIKVSRIHQTNMSSIFGLMALLQIIAFARDNAMMFLGSVANIR